MARLQANQRLACVVLGAGAWGTAMALHLVRLGHRVVLVPRDDGHYERLRNTRENFDFLPGVPFPENLVVERNFEVLQHADLAFLACPSAGVVEFCSRIQGVEFGKKSPFLVTLCKGFVPDPERLPLAVASEMLPNFQLGVLSGPTYALDVAQGKPTAVVLASQAASEHTERFQDAINAPNFRVYRTTDVLGVELGGCLKNPYAIGMGLASCLGFGDNGQAALFTRMMKEMLRIGVALGGRAETFYGLSGLGDFLATSQGEWSRNRTFGERVGRGESPESIISSQRAVVEGYRSAKSFHALCQKMGVPCPILDEIYGVLYENEPLGKVLENLMRRELKEEQ